MVKTEMDDLDHIVVGQELDGGWQVLEPRRIEHDRAGANRTYIAKHPDGRTAFVKVLDPRALGSLELLELQVQQFRYEKEILEKCGQRNMRRVVRALTSGELHIEGRLPIVLRYLVFEWADSDVRSQTDLDERVHVAASLRWLHHVATGLQELHFSSISHQDVRPANVLVMPDRAAKIGSLSRAHDQVRPRPGGDAQADPICAPPEVLYGASNRSHEDRRAEDLYALGSLAVFLFTGVGLNARIAHYMPLIHHWTQWQGSFGDMLEHLRSYYDQAIENFASQVDEVVREELVLAVRWLTDPDPKLRGDPTSRRGRSPYNVERFVSLFNVLANKAAIKTRPAA